jgi:hypothetical protein
MVDKSKFIPGLQLSELFYNEAVKSILDEAFPNLVYSAGLLGSGSEVLGFDTPQSMDHHWGPRMLLFLSNEDYEKYKENIISTLGEKLPHIFHDFPTNFGEPIENGVKLLKETTSGIVNHRVEISTIDSFLGNNLGFEQGHQMTTLDWLTLPEQKLLTISAGKVFYDGLNELENMRKKFSYYPQDIWLYLLSSQWMKISQEEPFVGRCVDVGDEIGSRLIAGRISQYLMKLCFMMEKRYSPYMKWFGTAFSKLETASSLSPVLNQITMADNYPDREAGLTKAYKIVTQKHNALSITPPIKTESTPFHGRPYLVIHADVIAQEIKKQIKDDEVVTIAGSNIGSIDQFVDSTDILEYPKYFEKLKIMYTDPK